MRTAGAGLQIGIGWRPELALCIARDTTIDFVEVVAENVSPARIPVPLRQLAERGIKIVPHGTSLSLGGAERPSNKRLSRLASLAEQLDAPMVSEHFAFVRAGDIEAGHLLPLQRTQESLDILVENILEAKAALPVPLALENVATLFEWPHAEMDEATFITQALERTDSLLLLDVSNLYANARNHNWNAQAYLDGLPLDRLGYVHIAGGVTRNGLYHDTHAHAIPDGALALLAEVCTRVERPPVLLERDDHFPKWTELSRELQAISETRNRAPSQREAACAS